MNRQSEICFFGIKDGDYFVEVKDGTVTAKVLDKCLGTHKFKVIPVYETPREKFIEAIKDLTPEELQKVKEFAELLRLKQSLNNSTN